MLKQFIAFIGIDSLKLQLSQLSLHQLLHLCVCQRAKNFLKHSTDQLLVVGENTLLDSNLVTLTRTEDVILLNLTCEFSIKEIKKLSVVEEVLAHGWMKKPHHHGRLCRCRRCDEHHQQLQG